MDSIRELGENIKNSLNSDVDIFYDDDLSLRTTMRVGGKTPLLVQPHNADALISCVKLSKEAGIRFYVLGGGSNLIFSDDGFDGMVLSTKKHSDIHIEENKIVAASGAKTNTLTEFTANEGIPGFSNFAGLPGTVGGAAYMNARCYETDFSSLIESITFLNTDSLLTETYNKKDSDWSYKHSPFMETNRIILSVQFSIPEEKKQPETLIIQNEFKIQDRNSKGHFRAPSSGSVFKNNREYGKSSGKIIDEAGLKGATIGGASVASWHGNFIINDGNATAKDVQALVKFVQYEVEEKTGFRLEPEVIFVS